MILILLNGLVMAADRYGGWGGFHETSWIAIALALFALSGVIWVVFLASVQRKMTQLAAISNTGALPVEFRHL